MEAIVKQVKGSMQSDVIEDEAYWKSLTYQSA